MHCYSKNEENLKLYISEKELNLFYPSGLNKTKTLSHFKS